MDLALGLINGPCWLSLARSLCYIRCHSRWGIRRHRCQKEAFCNWNGSSSSIIQDPGQKPPHIKPEWEQPQCNRDLSTVLDLWEGMLFGWVWQFPINFELEISLVLAVVSGSSWVLFVFGLSPRQGISIASFLRITEEIPVKPNPIFRAKILCMCEIKAGDKDKLCEMMSLQTGLWSCVRKGIPWGLCWLSYNQRGKLEMGLGRLCCPLVHTLGVLTSIHSHYIFIYFSFYFILGFSWSTMLC